MVNTQTKTFPLCFLNRLRMTTDGQGITTLVGAYGCPLRCRYCLNPRSWQEETPYTHVTPGELYERVKIDNLYFLATGGGITFGGGEPLTHAAFIYDFHDICPIDWRFTAETSLYISKENLYIATQVIDDFIVDIKDMDADIYKAYTGKSNDIVKENLTFLIKHVPAERIKVRVPRIPHVNTSSHVNRSIQELQNMGFEVFDTLTYRTDRT